MVELTALVMAPGPLFVDTLRRLWDDGGAVAPIDTRLPLPAQRRLLEALRPNAIASADGITRLDSGRACEEGDALVMSTSGTTGEPKGVVLTHAAVEASAGATSARLGVDPSRHRWLAMLPMAHVGGLGVVTKAYHCGVPLTVLDRFDVDSALAAARAGCTHTAIVPTMLASLDVSVFERVIVGGSASHIELPPNASSTYGLTETGSGCVYDDRPLDGVEVRVVDGEIHLRGPMLLRAYRTADREWDPRLEGGWFATGDLGDLDTSTGRLRVFGRRGDLIITGGQNVWPDPVERVLLAHPAVAEVAVVGRPDPIWGAAVTAVVVPADPAVPPTLDELRDEVVAELAPYCAPRRLELATVLPRTPLGKVQRSRL